MTLIGIDTGGTFTDFTWLDGHGRLRVHKQPTTPDDPSRAVVDGLAQADELPSDAAVIHGSTVATNALLERHGARTALITTAGFRDVLAIGRQNRPDLYALVPQKPPPLVERLWRLEAVERVSSAGEVLVPLDEEALVPALDQLAAGQIESVAVCLLFSFLHPYHERRIAQLVHRRLGPGVFVSLSVDILPEYREYERTAATVINAYVTPLMSRYLRRLTEQIAPRRLAVMQSNGGIISAAVAGAQAARTALSGPAGGVVGARYVARAAGFDDIITFDMGGTSSDVALCRGRAPVTTEGEIAGLPLHLPMIDIHTVGAGGGSLAHVDAGGALNVGPQSAGADPGPACYHADFGRWRVRLDQHFAPGRATVSDANLALGRLDPARFLGGTMALHEASARQALATLADELGGTVEDAAWAVVRVANANMERAMRRISVERGHDPRRFTLVAFGGGGPLHACELAEALDIPRVLAPPVPGVLSALGMLVAEPSRDYSQTVMLSPAEMAEAAAFAPLEERAREEMVSEGHDVARLSLHYGLDMRYRGQSHELAVPVTPEMSAEAMSDAFHAAHVARYGYARPEAAVEVVTARLSVVAPSVGPALQRRETSGADPAAAIIGRKPVWFGGGFVEATLYERERLRPGNFLAGPSVLYQYDTTTIIPPGWAALVDGVENLIITRSE